MRLRASEVDETYVKSHDMHPSLIDVFTMISESFGCSFSNQTGKFWRRLSPKRGPRETIELQYCQMLSDLL